MDKVKLEVSSWSKFRTRNFVVEPELLGQSHEFHFEEHRVRVELPSIDCLSEEETRGQQLSVGAYRETGGRKIPLEFEVHTVQ